MINVSWENARAYLSWLSERTGREYRLLSEAEWEYVARAGTATARYWGESSSAQCAYGNGLDADAEANYNELIAETGWEWVRCSDGYVDTAPTGSYQPNAFGLHDVLGNVAEWTEDCWHESYAGAPGNGRAWIRGDCETRVFRGGNWIGQPDGLRSASRGWSSAGFGLYQGFRVARTLD